MATINGFVHAKPAASYDHGEHVVMGMKLEFWEWDDMLDQGYVLVGPATINVDIPQGWDPRPTQIKALESKREELCKQLAESVMKIDQQISQLRAIEYVSEAA